jgi:uncharacterized protein
MEQIIRISEFILKSFLHIWPYLLVTIPLAVIVNLSGASRYITVAFGKNPLLSVFLATVVGAFSPFCSCGVIPVISSLLIGGVPLAPVMSFWIASPSMDPEVFFLSSSVIGWNLAVWRLAATFVISLAAGYITHFATIQGFISHDVLRMQRPEKSKITMGSLANLVRSLFDRKPAQVELLEANLVSVNGNCCTVLVNDTTGKQGKAVQHECKACTCKDSGNKNANLQWKRVSEEIMKATFMVAKFMGLAFLVTALITFYLPDDIIGLIVNENKVIQVVLATVIGIPLYTSNITALPLVGGLIELGMNKGAALSFLIAGATTTLPAMVAVWGIAKPRIFMLYLLYILVGSLTVGILFNVFNG